MSEPDFIGIYTHPFDKRKRNVARMRWDKTNDGYVVAELHVIGESEATEAATKWAEREKLELR